MYPISYYITIKIKQQKAKAKWFCRIFNYYIIFLMSWKFVAFYMD